MLKHNPSLNGDAPITNTSDYAYELGSRSAVAWVLESNRVRADKASGIRNDPNEWAAEHNDPTFILDLVGRIVTVSMRTLDIVESLPSLDQYLGLADIRPVATDSDTRS